MTVASREIVPGAWVRHPERPDWGRGQIQSVAGFANQRSISSMPASC